MGKKKKGKRKQKGIKLQRKRERRKKKELNRQRGTRETWIDSRTTQAAPQEQPAQPEGQSMNPLEMIKIIEASAKEAGAGRLILPGARKTP